MIILPDLRTPELANITRKIRLPKWFLGKQGHIGVIETNAGSVLKLISEVLPT